MKQLNEYVGLTCKVCNEGVLQLKTETKPYTYLEVYELPITASFITCSVCGASIIPLISRKNYRLQVKQKINQLYYE